MKFIKRFFIPFLLYSTVNAAGKDVCKPLPPEPDTIRDRAIWEQPVCPCPSGKPISWSKHIGNDIVTVKPYGYAKWEGYWDSRQPVGAREEEALIFPRPQKLDPNGIDINSHGKWHMTSVETRFGFALTGPEWNGIKISGLVEADFRGPIETTIATVRLRHSFGKIAWESGSFLFGQFWHPLFILECFPHTVAFAIGAPLEPQARDAQLRLTQRWDWFELIFALASQREFASNGPIGLSTEYIRNSVTPNIHLQCRGYFKDNVVGIAADYKRIVPRIESEKMFSVKERLGSFIVEGFASFLYAPWSLRLKGFWAQNGSDQFLLSGYGVRTVDETTDKRTYSNTAGAGGWLDFSYLFGCDDREVGLFVGGIKNLGSRHNLFIDPDTKEPIIFSFTGFGPDIDYVVRVAPRFVFKKDPIRFGAEVEWTRASFGTPNCRGRICNGIPVDNVRVLFALYYLF